MCQCDTDAATRGHCVREKCVRDIRDIWDVVTRVILYASIENGKGIKKTQSHLTDKILISDKSRKLFTFHVALHCLPKYPFMAFQYKKGYYSKH